MLPVKKAFQPVTSEGARMPDITTFGFVTDRSRYIHTYIQGLPKLPILQASKLLYHNR